LYLLQFAKNLLQKHKKPGGIAPVLANSPGLAMHLVIIYHDGRARSPLPKSPTFSYRDKIVGQAGSNKPLLKNEVDGCITRLNKQKQSDRPHITQAIAFSGAKDPSLTIIPHRSGDKKEL
jgi:hypothetical protein